MNKKEIFGIGIFSIVLILLLFPLFTLSQSHQIEPTTKILDERTEESCYTENNIKYCTWKQYVSKKFEYYDGNYPYYEDFLTNVGEEVNLDIRYTYLDGTQVTFTPIIEKDNIKLNIRDLPSEDFTSLNYDSLITKERDYSKFSISLQKITGLTKVGFKIESYEQIDYIDYNYTPSGVYEDIIPEYPVTDLIINNKRYSFVDLIENNFNTEYDKQNNELWIYLEDKDGYLTLDPASSSFNSSLDGHWNFNPTCDSATYTGNTDPVLTVFYILGGDNESLRRQAIEEGINNTILNGQTIHTDQQIYITYPNSSQSTGTFDKAVERSNQTWGFNYITSGEAFTNMLSLLNIANIWENTSLEYNETVSQVENFINDTVI